MVETLKLPKQGAYVLRLKVTCLSIFSSTFLASYLIQLPVIALFLPQSPIFVPYATLFPPFMCVATHHFLPVFTFIAPRCRNYVNF